MPGSDFDARLLAAQAGDEESVAVIFRMFHSRLARYLAARAPGVADDLEAEVWLAVASRLHAFTGDEGAFTGWIFSIARRRLADHRRTAARRRTAPAPDSQLDTVDESDPADMVAAALDGAAAARTVVELLPADQAEVVLLRVVAGLEVDQVAQLLGKKPGTIRVLQHRALRRLEKKLSDGRNAETVRSD